MKKNKNKLDILLEKKMIIESQLRNTLYGSIEIKVKNNKRYIYVHYRKDEKVLTKYIGEYSDEKIKQINFNNDMVKELKNQKKKINKELDEMLYQFYLNNIDI